MTYQRLAYEDAATTDQMTSDCRAAGTNLPLPGQRADASDNGAPAIVVTEQLAEMAAGLHLHFE